MKSHVYNHSTPVSEKVKDIKGLDWDRWPLAGEHGWEEQNEVSVHTRGIVSAQRMGNGMDILEILKFLK